MLRLFPRVMSIVAALLLAGCSGTMDMFKAKDGAIESGTLGSTAKPEDVAAQQPAEAVEAMAADVSVQPGQVAVRTETTLVEAGPAAAPAPAVIKPLAKDDVSLGKQYYRTGNFGLAEKYFRAAAESQPRNPEAWLGLAAAYDELRRFDLADRAYAQAIRIVGERVEIINNQGYSYILRGDYKRARERLMLASVRAPDNPQVQANMQLLAARSGRPVVH
jgi:Flp pilus assembly protein TadD